MALFKFRLESYRRIISHEKDETEMEFAMKMAKVREAEAMLHGLRSALEKTLSEREKRLASGLSTGEYQLFARRIDYLRGEVERAENEVARREIEAEAAKKRLLDLHVRERLVERLKEKAVSEYLKNEAKKIQDELDDICSAGAKNFSPFM